MFKVYPGIIIFPKRSIWILSKTLTASLCVSDVTVIFYCTWETSQTKEIVRRTSFYWEKEHIVALGQKKNYADSFEKCSLIYFTLFPLQCLCYPICRNSKYVEKNGISNFINKINLPFLHFSTLVFFSVMVHGRAGVILFQASQSRQVQRQTASTEDHYHQIFLWKIKT